MRARAIVYCEGEFGRLDGKVANGLSRHSEKYEILGIIDSTKAGHDAGDFLDGIRNGIPIFSSSEEAIKNLGYTPEYFIYGIAAITAFLNNNDRGIIFAAMEKGMNIINGLPEFLTEDEEFIQKAKEYGVVINDMRKSPPRKDLHNFSGRINEVTAPIITVLGTDCAVGKRTTAVKLVEALKKAGLNTAFIATGQTGLLQGAAYGAVVDVLSSGFASGEVENAIIKAYETEHPDIIIVEGQGALSHPAYTSSHAIVRGSVPDAVILQHPPCRNYRCDYPLHPMPTVEGEIELIEVFSKTKVIAITINHEDMTDDQVINTINEYEYKYELPTTDALLFGCDKLVESLFKEFPKLREVKSLVC